MSSSQDLFTRARCQSTSSDQVTSEIALWFNDIAHLLYSTWRSLYMGLNVTDLSLGELHDLSPSNCMRICTCLCHLSADSAEDKDEQRTWNRGASEGDFAQLTVNTLAKKSV